MKDPDFPDVDTDESQPKSEDIIPMTPRDVKFIKNYAATGFDPAKRVNCALDAGFHPRNIAAMNSGRIIHGLVNNKKMQRAMKKEGIDVSRLAKKLGQLLEAESAQFPGKPDNFIQLKATQEAAKLQDLYPPTRLDVDKSVRHEIVISEEVMDRVKHARKMSEQFDGELIADAECNSAGDSTS